MIKRVLSSKAEPIFILLALLVIYIAGMLVPLNDNDSAHHATIGLNMYLNNDPVSLISHGTPYLDKPHFRFWLLYISYALFGVTTFAYKISSLLFSVLSILSVYKISLRIFSKEVAKISVLVLSTSFAFMMANVDVRMDAILTGAVTFAIWQFIKYCDNQKWGTLILLALGCAIAFSVKGWYGVGIIGLTSLCYLLINSRFKIVLSFRFLAVIPLFLIFSLPVFIAYYIQYDLHPELVVRGTTGNSGLRFILFDHFYGRMSGNEFGKASSNDYFFFYHTLAWSILPWTLLFFTGMFGRIKGLITGKHSIKNLSYVFLFPVIIVCTIMGFSSFKLPQYIVPLFPLTSIFTASWIDSLSNKECRLAGGWQMVVNILMLFSAILLNLWVFPIEADYRLLLYIIIIGISLLFYFTNRGNSSMSIAYKGTFAAIIFWTLFNMNFFPQLLTYQAGQQIAQEVKKLDIDPKRVFILDKETDTPFSFDFYTGCIHKFATPDSVASVKNGEKIFLLVEEWQLSSLDSLGISYNKLFTKRDYRITRLNAKFLNPKSREKVITKLNFIEVNP